MTPTLRHIHRDALYQRRQLLRQRRREQEPVPAWFGGLGYLRYRDGQRPVLRPPAPLSQRLWQGTRQRLSSVVTMTTRALWACRYVGMAGLVVGLLGSAIYGVHLGLQHLPSLSAPQLPPHLSGPGQLPGMESMWLALHWAKTLVLPIGIIVTVLTAVGCLFLGGPYGLYLLTSTAGILMGGLEAMLLVMGNF